MNQEDMQNKIDSILKESKKNNELKQKKERKNKGKSVNAYVSDYCVVDIETTDSIPFYTKWRNYRNWSNKS